MATPIKKVSKVPLVEIFGPTIEGEGNVIGYQTIFLRFGGCDYKCQRCDSLHAVLPSLYLNDTQTQILTVDELIKTTEDFLKEKVPHCEWITLSGGNPCMWDITEFIDHFRTKTISIPAQTRDVPYRIALETQGTIWREWIHNCDKITVSPKGPGMGERFEQDKFDRFVYELVNHPGFTIKVVVFDQRDLDFASTLLERHPYMREKFFLSIGNENPPAPAARYNDEEETHQQFVMRTLKNMKILLEDIMTDPRLASTRVLPQLHTLLWANETGR